jgi:glycosyltransferase involved in cell wall biosynthesis
MTLVSILIPLYNAEPYIAETIQSVMNQSYPNIECIIVDDGSTDNGLAIAREFENEQIRVLSQKNKGASATRNKAFENCTGELIQYLDADDLLHPDKIKLQVEEYHKHNNPNILLSGTWGRFTLDKNQVIWEQQMLNKSYYQPINWLIDSWNGLGMAQPGVWLTPRVLIEKAGPWDKSLSLNDDGEFFCRVLLQAKAIQFVSDSKVYYRSNMSTSISQSRSDKAKRSELNSYILYCTHTLLNNEKIELRKALANNFIHYTYQYYSSDKALAKQAISEFNKLNVGKMWPLGGKRFKQFAGIIGFKNALLIKRTLNL